MLVSLLSRVPEFSNLPAAELKALAQQTVVVCLPADRQVVSPGCATNDFLYLLRGTLALEHGRISATRFGSVKHFYPGTSSARTQSSCLVACMRRQLHEFARNGAKAAADYDMDSAPWLKRFLSSHMMRQLSSREWQKLLRGFAAEQFARGEHVVQAGSPGDCCYVLEAGHAVVHNGGKTLCHLNPGDFFGEDALLADAPRNATVTALTPVKVQKIDHALFRTVLVDTLVEFVDQRGAGKTICVERIRDADLREGLRNLPVKQQLYVTGGSRAERALVTFLLVQRGYIARAVAEKHA